MTACDSCGEPIDPTARYVTTGYFHPRGPSLRHGDCADREDGPSIPSGVYLPMTRELMADFGHPSPGGEPLPEENQ